MKRYLYFILVLTFAIVTFGCSNSSTTQAPTEQTDSTAATETFVLKYAGTLPKGSDFNLKVEEPMAQLFKEKSNGRITLEMYNGGTLAAQGNAIEAVKSGQADIAYDLPAMYGGVYPMIDFIDRPGIYTPDSVSGTQLRSEYLTKFAQDEFNSVKVIAAFSTGPLGIITTKPVKTVEDLKGIQIRASGTQLPFFSALKATSVSLPISEVYEGLKMNVIDAAFLSDYAIPAFKFQEVSNYYTNLPMCQGTNILVMSKELYDSMPADLQKVVDEVSAEITNIAGEYGKNSSEKARERVKTQKPSYQFIDLDETVKKQLVDTGLTLAQQKAKELDGKGLKGTEAYEWLVSQTIGTK